MFLLQYSIDCIWYDPDSGDEDYPHTGELEVITGTSQQELIDDLMERVKTYTDEFGINTIIENEFYYNRSGEYKVDQEFLSIYGVWEIKDIVSLELKDTPEYKEYVTKRYICEQEYKKQKEEQSKILLEKQERKELQRLKDKYDN